MTAQEHLSFDEEGDNVDRARERAWHGRDRTAVQRQIAYYDDLTSAVRAAVEIGWSEDQAAGEIRLPDYEAWGQYEAWFPMNVRGVYRWLASGSQ